MREWLTDLGLPDKKAIGEDIKEIELGWPRDYRPKTLIKHLEGKLWEVRSNVSDGKISRVLFAVIESKMILLHAFIKKSQKTPRHEIDLAERRLSEFLRGQNG